MDVISAARQLGKALQADERYKRIAVAQDKSDMDKNLQDEIGAFNMKRAQLNAEMQKTEKDSDKIKEIDEELKKMYAKIFENQNMIEFTEAKAGMEEMVGQINKIVSGSASGEDPDKIDPFAADCGGECGGCAGCH